jgi:flagellar biosynthetic protein FliQ
VNTALVVEIGRQALIIVLVIAGPLLMAGLVVGLMVGVFQAVTQIHEMTLTFIPKILAITGMFLALLPWMLMKMLDYTANLIGKIPALTG